MEKNEIISRSFEFSLKEDNINITDIERSGITNNYQGTISERSIYEGSSSGLKNSKLLNLPIIFLINKSSFLLRNKKYDINYLKEVLKKYDGFQFDVFDEERNLKTTELEASIYDISTDCVTIEVEY